jgi:hypothetical protein
MRLFLATASILTAMVLLPACNPPAPVEVYTPEGEVRTPDGPSAPEDLPLVQQSGLNIGDLEQTVHLNIVLSERSEATNITVAPLTDRLDRIQLLRIIVEPPYPESLWLQPVVDSNNDFSEQPAIFRGVYRRNNVALDSFAQVLGERRRNEYPQPPIDILSGLPGTPDSLLLEVDLEGVLYPAGYEAGAIEDPARATSDTMSTAMYGTTVRVEFVGRPAAPDATAPAETPPPESGASANGAS